MMDSSGCSAHCRAAHSEKDPSTLICTPQFRVTRLRRVLPVQTAAPDHADTRLLILVALGIKTTPEQALNQITLVHLHTR